MGEHYANQMNLVFPDSNAEPDIVYSEVDSLWHCCEAYSATRSVNCSIPTNDTFQAPPPEKVVDLSLSSLSTSSIPTSSSSTNSNVGLGTGATVGMGVGVALGIVLISIMILSIRKWQRGQQKTVPPRHELEGTQELGKGGKDSTDIQRQPGDQQGGHELQGQAIDSELDPSRGAFYEVESGG